MPGETHSFICTVCDKGHEITLSVSPGVEVYKMAPEEKTPFTLSYQCPVKLVYKDYIFFVPKSQEARYLFSYVAAVRILSKTEEEKIRNE